MSSARALRLCEELGGYDDPSQRNDMRIASITVLLAMALCVAGFGLAFVEAPSGFDGLSNGSVDQATMDAAHDQFAEIESVNINGLGPLYNAVSCLDCHQSVSDGGHSQVRELRAGHLDQRGTFVAATIALNDGSTVGPRSLINLRAVCPEAIGQLGLRENVRALRLSLALFGDGFVEAVSDDELLRISRNQFESTHGVIQGQPVYVDLSEGTRGKRIG